MVVETKSPPLPLESPPRPRRMSYREFLDALDEDTSAEWVDGEVVIMAPANWKHQDLAGFLSALLRLFVESTDAGVVLAAPFQMKLSRVARGREPDVMFVAKENADRLKDTYLDGPADLVIEIASPKSELTDRGEKYAEYETEGVREYWLLDPSQRRADFFVLGEDGRYERRRPDADGAYRSVVLRGFAVKEDWFWREPLPKVAEALKQMEALTGGADS